MERKAKPDPYAVERAAGTPAAAAGTPPAAATGKAAAAMFSSKAIDGVHVIEFTTANVIDAYYIECLGDGIYHHIREIEAPKVVIDLAMVQHLSSAALGMFIALKKVVEKKGGAIAIANVNAEIREVFKLTNLQKLIKLHDTTEKAVRSIG